MINTVIAAPMNIAAVAAPDMLPLTVIRRRAKIAELVASVRDSRWYRAWVELTKTYRAPIYINRETLKTLTRTSHRAAFGL